MSRFVESTTARVDLGDGDWVEIRTRLTFGDRRALEEILLGKRVMVDDKESLHHAAANIEWLRRSIVSWGGPGFCDRDRPHPHEGECSSRPVTTENLAQLDETGDAILVAIRTKQVTHSAFLASTRDTSTSTDSPPEPAPSTSPATTATSARDSTLSISANGTAGRGTS